MRGPDARRLAPATLAVVGAAVLAWTMARGWYPHDEGALGQSALRLLGGEWPHRDFDEIYTFALSAWHAAWFAWLGPSSLTMRIALATTTLPWMLLVYAIARRTATPWMAAGIAFTCLAWSVPSYAASMPSWYILFCATAAAWAMLRWQDNARPRWIFLAGVLSGIAVLFKLSGVLITAGLCLAWMLSLSDAERAPTPTPTSGLPIRWLAMPLFAVALLIAVTVGRGGDREFFRFAVPLLVILSASGLAAWRDGGRVAWSALTPAAVLLAGAALPVIGLAALYLALDALPALADGVLIAPFRRVAFAAKRPPSPEVIELALPMLLLLLLPSARPRWTGPVARLGGVFFAVVVIASGFRYQFYRVGWYSAWGLLFAVALGAAWLALRETPDDSKTRTEQRKARTLACMAIGLALLEYPFASAIYVLYSLPLVMLAAAALARSGRWMHGLAQAVALGFFLAFGVFRLLPGGLDGLATYYARNAQTARLALPRGGITVPPSDSARYGAMVSFVQEVAAGRNVWAGPDAAEVYFLAGVSNRTRTLFDFFDADSITQVPLVTRLARANVDVVVVKEAPSFSPPLTPDVRAALATAFPKSRQFQGFEVRWR